LILAQFVLAPSSLARRCFVLAPSSLARRCCRRALRRVFCARLAVAQAAKNALPSLGKKVKNVITSFHPLKKNTSLEEHPCLTRIDHVGYNFLEQII
jgi:hypothetical protein